MPADEFDIIRALFAPLAREAGARGLSDDVALIDVTGQLVVTTDAIVEGVHFLPGDPIGTVAKKALRVNLSDLTAKGAKPAAVLLTLIWPVRRPAAQIGEFAAALGEDLAHYKLALLGGDTSSTPGPLTVSITAFGAPYGSRTPARCDAKAGEQVWVTGSIGDACLGLMSLTRATGDQADRHVESVRVAYRLPSPPVDFAEAIARLASASIDVSDGLIGDAEKIAAASGVAIRLDGEAIPLSASGQAHVMDRGVEGLADLITHGDDYQALFTASPRLHGDIIEAGRAVGVRVALIGEVMEGAGVRVVAGGAELALTGRGHAHRLGA